jgi:tetratricopeptide (TPR) repeat protein
MPDSPRIEELRRRVQSDPASIAFAALAEEYRRVGRFDEAIETCNAGLVRHPSYLSAHVTLGRALIDVGRLAEARVPLQYVLQLAPENLAAIRGLAEIHDRLGEAPVPQEESAVPEPAGPTMTVDEIHAASGFTRPEVQDSAPEQSNVSGPIQVEPMTGQVAEVCQPLPPSPIVDPVADEEPAPVHMPAVAAQVVDVEPPTLIEPPALAGLEEFLGAILRRRAERVAAR